MTETIATTPGEGYVVAPSRDGLTIHVSKHGKTVVAEPTPRGLAAAKAALEYRPPSS
jgi:hypothetical protein